MAYLAGGVKYCRKGSLFCKKAPQKTFATFTRALAMYHWSKKVLRSFFKSDRLLP
jgi:hypothetical protein